MPKLTTPNQPLTCFRLHIALSLRSLNVEVEGLDDQHPESVFNFRQIVYEFDSTGLCM
jgi:hypothetical protein